MIYLVQAAALTAWVIGLVLVKGFWMTLAAVMFPPVAWVYCAGWMMGV